MITTRKAQLLDVVEVLEDLPQFDVKCGEHGAVVEVFDDPEEAYIIEFVDESGKSRIADWVKPSQIATVDELAREAFGRGVSSIRGGNRLEAEKEFARAISLKPAYIVELHNQIINAFKDSQEWETLIDALRLVMRLNPSYEVNGYSLEALARNNLAMAYLNRAVQLWHEGNMERSLVLLDIAIAVGPTLENSNVIKRNLASAYTSLGIEAAKREDYHSVLGYMSFACQIESNEQTRYNLGMAYAQMAVSYMKNKDFDSAICAFRYALDIGLTTPELYNDYAISLVSVGSLSEAIMVMEEALNLSPENLTIKKNLNVIREAKQIESKDLYSIEQIEAQFYPAPPIQEQQFQLAA